jgi:hypothetical protein
MATESPGPLDSVVRAYQHTRTVRVWCRVFRPLVLSCVRAGLVTGPSPPPSRDSCNFFLISGISNKVIVQYNNNLNGAVPLN